MSPSAKFITDEQGEKKVILPVSEYEELLEDLADLAVVAERASESKSSLEQVIARLKTDGLL